MRDTILCLCDLTGVMARPWVEHGYKAVLVDPQHGATHEDGAMLKLACTIRTGCKHFDLHTPGQKELDLEH